tara:strand:- start:314 stop:553 length:240 start_codon:yes stop_codon:yes gene_type:complete
MIDEERLKKAFAKVKEEFDQIKWKLEKIDERLTDLSGQVNKNDSKDSVVLERPLVEKSSVEKPKEIVEESSGSDEEEFY